MTDANHGGPPDHALAPASSGPETVEPAITKPSAAAESEAVAETAHEPPAHEGDHPPQEKKAKKKKKKEDKLGRGVETMFRTSYRTHLDLSQMADNKANIMISINGIIISVVIASVSPKIDSNPWLLVPTTVLLVGCAVSLIYAVLSARPRVTSHVVTLEDVRSNRANILFFGNFVNMKESDYLEGMVSLIDDSDRLYANMMRDLYSLGGVLKRKYKLLRTAYNMFMVALVVSVFLFIVVFVIVAPTGGLVG